MKTKPADAMSAGFFLKLMLLKKQSKMIQRVHRFFNLKA